MWQCIARTTCSGLLFSVEYIGSFSFSVRLAVVKVSWKEVMDVSCTPTESTFVITSAKLANEISSRAACALKNLNASRNTA